MGEYTSKFYAQHAPGMGRSADAVLPLVLQALAPASVRSVVDVGCGEGHWLAAAMRLGAADVIGVDGDYVQLERLAIPRERFVAADLRSPPKLERRFDLAMCLEVGEHLAPEHAVVLVEYLCGLAPAVLFSAAIPMQGGTGHVNEQWPDHWAALFRARGMLCADVLRPALWDRDDVEWWYVQNAMLFVQAARLEEYPALRGRATDAAPLRLVHPRNFLEKAASLERARRRGMVGRVKRWIRARKG